MNSNEYIFNQLSNDALLVSLLWGADKVVGWVADEDVKAPLISIFRLDRERSFSMKSIQKHIFQLSVWSEDEILGDNIADRVDDLLHWLRSDENWIKSVLVLRDDSRWDKNSRLYGIHITVKVKVVK